MPRAMRDTPIAMPTGIAVTHASRNAANTRRGSPRSARAAACPPWMSPFARVGEAREDDLRASAGRVADPAEMASRATTARRAPTIVTTLISVLVPSPGVAVAGRRAQRRRGGVGAVAGVPVVGAGRPGVHGRAPRAVLGAEWMTRSISSRRRMNSGTAFTARASRVSMKRRPKSSAVAMRDPPGRRRHHDQLGGEEERLLDAVRDEEEHLASCPTTVEDRAPGSARA